LSIAVALALGRIYEHTHFMGPVNRTNGRMTFQGGNAMKRITCSLAVAAVFLTGLTAGESQAAFPEKEITWIVPFSPGGGFDAWSRQIAVAMKKYLPGGADVVIKNVTGAGGRTGTITVYRAKPDGYTVGLLDVAGLISYQKAVGADKAGFDIDKFVWVGRVATEPWVLMTSAKSPLKTLGDLKNKKDLSWGIEGPGSTKWLFSVLEAREMGIPMRFVSGYGGTGELIPASIRGDFDVWTNAGPAHVPYVSSGDLRAILQTGHQRMAAFPDVPTVKELGYNLVAEIFRLVAAPPGTPADRVKVLEEAFLKAMNDKDFKSWVEKSKQEANPGGQKEAAQSAADFSRLVEKHMNDLRESLQKQ
jgi:tripartite-type tricarboxylate transporter receptor subunit TctC